MDYFEGAGWNGAERGLPDDCMPNGEADIHACDYAVRVRPKSVIEGLSVWARHLKIHYSGENSRMSYGVKASRRVLVNLIEIKSFTVVFEGRFTLRERR